MKATTILILFMFVAYFSSGQDLRKTNILRNVDVTPPVFTGVKGTVAVINNEKTVSIYDYLGTKIEYPKSEAKWRVQGTEVIQFTVLPDGTLDDFQIICSVSDDIDDEIIRLLKSTDGMWKPGHNNDNPVAMVKEIAVTFKMEYSNHLKLAQKLFKRGTKKLLKDKEHRALKLFDRAYVYQPFSQPLLFARGVTRHKVGNKDGACEDWNRLKYLGSNLADVYLMQYCEESELAVNDE